MHRLASSLVAILFLIWILPLGYFIKPSQEKMAAENPSVHERTLFIIKAMLSMYLRISELTENERWLPRMKDFYKDSEGRGCLWAT